LYASVIVAGQCLAHHLDAKFGIVFVEKSFISGRHSSCYRLILYSSNPKVSIEKFNLILDAVEHKFFLNVLEFPML
jgi:hypothetical protein